MLAEILALVRPWNLGGKAEASSRRSELIDARGEDTTFELVPEEHFRKVLSIEQKRAERSERRFVLMLVHVGKIVQTAGGEAIPGIAEALNASTRETDMCGWYNQGSVAGVVCTEIGTGELDAILSALHSKVTVAIRSRLEPEQVNVIPVSFHVFPEAMRLGKEIASTDASASPDLQSAWSTNPSDYATANSQTS